MATMTLTEIIPLKTDKDGVIRVSKTRVTLDTIVAAFTEGAAAEEIAYQYPVVPLADIYSVIGYYLRNKKQVEQYLKRRGKFAEEVRKQNEVKFNSTGIRERLLARGQAENISMLLLVADENFNNTIVRDCCV